MGRKTESSFSELFMDNGSFGGEGAQARLLEADGIEVVGGKVDLEKYGM